MRAPLKRARALHDRKGRSQEGRFLIEGVKLLEEAIHSGVELVEVLALDSVPPFWGPVPHHMVTPQEMAKAATTSSPPPVLAIARIPHPHAREVRCRLVIDDLQDPGNLGTLIRLAEATGVDQVVITPATVDPFNPKVVRSAMGSLFRMPLATLGPHDLGIWREQGFQVVATDLNAHHSPFTLAWQPRVVLLVGQESRGLSAALVASATHRVRLPMCPPVESLNVAVATAVFLYEAARQRGVFHG